MWLVSIRVIGCIAHLSYMFRNPNHFFLSWKNRNFLNIFSSMKWFRKKNTISSDRWRIFYFNFHARTFLFFHVFGKEKFRIVVDFSLWQQQQQQQTWKRNENLQKIAHSTLVMSYEMTPVQWSTDWYYRAVLCHVNFIFRFCSPLCQRWGKQWKWFGFCVMTLLVNCLLYCNCCCPICNYNLIPNHFLLLLLAVRYEYTPY